jgi:hypothetical protein
MITKKKVHQLIDKMPSKIDWDDIQYRFYVMSKIERSRDSVKDGLVDQDEIDKEFCK